MGKGLNRHYWLDLSKPIAGVVYWHSQASQAAQRESVFVRIELWAGSEFVGGDWHFMYVGYAQPAWTPFYVKFRPETAKFPTGAILNLKVYQQGGLTDFTIGTGGTHQSVLELRTFDSDPLAGALYVGGQQRHLYIGNTTAQTPTSGASTTPAAVANAGLLLGLTFAGVVAPARTRRGNRMLLLSACLAAAGFAGCAHPGSQNAGGAHGLGSDGAASTTQAPVKTTIVTDPTLHGEGAMEGVVREAGDFGVGIGGANVTLVGTSLSSWTRYNGSFAFHNVTAGSYVLRAEATGYALRETVVKVWVGKRTHVEVPLSRATGGSIHPHDDWEGKRVRPLFDAATMFPVYGAGTALSGSGYWANSGLAYPAAAPIPVPEGAVVLAGTSEVTLTLDWAQGPGAPSELGLLITTTTNQSSDQYFLPRAPNIPFRVVIFPNEADPGHQKYTDWTFSVVLPNAGTYGGNDDAFQSPMNMGGPISVHATITKGVVPLEPIHPDPWGNETQLTLFDKKPYVSWDFVGGISVGGGGIAVGGGSTTGLRDGEVFPSMSVWVPGWHQFVPASTKQIRGTFSVISAGNLTGLSLLGYGAGVPFPRPVTWSLVYHPGNEPITKAVWKRVPDVAITGTGTVSFTMSVPADEVDPFYAATSRWRFSPEHDAFGETRPYLYESPKGTRFELSITIERDTRP